MSKSMILINEDPYLKPFAPVFQNRIRRADDFVRIHGKLESFATGHLYYGLHRDGGEWVFREWLPEATGAYLSGDHSAGRLQEDYRLKRINDYGDWELRLDNAVLEHGMRYALHVEWKGGEGMRLPAYAHRVVQDPDTYLFQAQVWNPPRPYQWSINNFTPPKSPLLIYEAHIGMAQEEERVGTFREFAADVLPRIIRAGYNTVQFMALMEHPYYGSFGYQVSNFFALSSRFGTPEEFKALVDQCHETGVAVIMDLVHSHSVKNETEGLGRQDGTPYLYFHEGERGYHPAWDSRCFDYAKPGVCHFLLSNCAYWLSEYNLDGFRFDGVTSMLYKDHGLGTDFNSYDHYFGEKSDEDAVTYLTLANRLIHSLRPEAITIAEDMSGMPGVARDGEIGGLGFDYRLAMGIPDFWIRLIKEKRDEEWDPQEIWNTLNNRRFSEKNIAYAESHDQALVGDKTLLFRLMDAAMYDQMGRNTPSPAADRGTALHKLIRLMTLSLGGDGYMNFMGNEFGHPEWIDFPREGNGWSYRYARRQWRLADAPDLRYRDLAAFDRDMLASSSPSLEHPFADLLLVHRDDQILVYCRGPLFYVINLNGSESFPEYTIPLPPGNYRGVLDSDAPEYGGHGRTGPLQTLLSSREEPPPRLYLPTRTALVFRKIE